MKGKQAGSWTATILLALGAILMLAPLAWLVSTAFKPESQIFADTPRWIPSPPTTAHFREVAQRGAEAPIGRWLLNSFIVSTSVTSLTVLVTSMAAYPLAECGSWPRRYLLSHPGRAHRAGQVTTIPVFLLIQWLGWFDTYPRSSFLDWRAIRSLPAAAIHVDDPARDGRGGHVDGCGPWRTWSQIILPLSKPALATLATLTFLASWNDFMWPLIVTNSIEMRTIPSHRDLSGRYSTEYGNMMATALIASLRDVSLHSRSEIRLSRIRPNRPEGLIVGTPLVGVRRTPLVVSPHRRDAPCGCPPHRRDALVDVRRTVGRPLWVSAARRDALVGVRRTVGMPLVVSAVPTVRLRTYGEDIR